MALALVGAPVAPALAGVGDPKAAFSDFNEDDSSDFLGVNASGSTYEFQINGTTGTTLLGSSGPGPFLPAGWSVIGIADFNNDDRADVLAVNGSGQTYLFFMNGTSIVDASGAGPVIPAGWSAVGVGDFNNDGACDLMIVNDTSGLTYQFHFAGTALLASSGPGPTIENGWQAVGIYDFDGLNGDDLMIANTTSGLTYQFHFDTDGTTVLGTSGTGPTIENGWQIEAIADFNGDAVGDILISENSTGRGYEFLLNGTTVLGSSGLFGRVLLPANWVVAAVGRFDANTSFDVLVRNTVSGLLYAYLLNGTLVLGTSSVVTTLQAGWTIPIVDMLSP